MSHQSDSTPTKIPKRYGGAFNPRSVTMPIAAVCMAVILYTYSVTSIRAAKRNAQLHREADGGQLDMRRESLRRHGVLDPVQGTKGYELFRESGTGSEAKNETQNLNGPGEQDQERDRAAAAPRTEVESGLESYKGLGTSEAVRKFKEQNKVE